MVGGVCPNSMDAVSDREFVGWFYLLRSAFGCLWHQLVPAVLGCVYSSSFVEHCCCDQLASLLCMLLAS